MRASIDFRCSAEARADADAIARVLAGETDAFSELVGRHQAGMYRYAVSMVLDHDEAADLVQDAFLRTFVALRACRDRRRFRAWVFQTLRHLCLDYLKNVRRRDVRLDEAPAQLVAAGDPPGRALDDAERAAGLRRALDDVPDLLREAFVMHYVNGVPYDTMADLLDVSVSALKMRVLRAREHLQAVLGGADVTRKGTRSSDRQRRAPDTAPAAARIASGQGER